MSTATVAPFSSPIGRRWAGVAARCAVVALIHIVAILGIVQLDPEPRARIEPVLVHLIAPPAPKIDSLSSPPALVAPPKIKPKPKVAPRPVAKRFVPATPARSRESALSVDRSSMAQVASTAPKVQAPTPAKAQAALGVEPVSTPAAAAVLPRPQVPVIAPRFDVEYLHNPRPAYPRIARRLGEHGRVTLQVFVTSDGHPAKVEVNTSSGYTRLDRAALEAVQKWEFVPARRGEQAVGAWVLVPITFVLEG